MRTPSLDIAAMADPGSLDQMRQAGQIRHLEKINGALGWLCAALIVGLTFYYFSQQPHPADIEAPPAASSPATTGDDIVLSGPVTDGRTAEIGNLFEARTDAGASTADFSSQYKVVGIILDGHSQAVLKDRQTGKSFFVHKGDRLGDAIVGDIREDKVVLSAGQQNWELRP